MIANDLGGKDMLNFSVGPVQASENICAIGVEQV